MVIKYDIKMFLFIFYISLLKVFYPKGNLNRFENAIKSYINLLEVDSSNHSRKSRDFVYPGITHKPWYEPDDHRILNFVNNKLTQGFSDIESEWLAYSSSSHNLVSRFNASDLFTSLKKDDWKAYLLWKEGKFTKIGLSAFPKTVGVLSKLECFLFPFGHIEFYVMKSGVALPPHRDMINTSLTCHLGIIIPEDCGIKVGDKTRGWMRGKTLFFDDSFEHEAWNKSNQERVVLSFDLYHPEMTNIEKKLLPIVMKNLNSTTYG